MINKRGIGIFIKVGLVACFFYNKTFGLVSKSDQAKCFKRIAISYYLFTFSSFNNLFAVAIIKRIRFN